ENKIIAVIALASYEHDDFSSYTKNGIETLAAGIGGVVAHLRTEKALQESEKRYRELYTRSRDGFVRTDLEGQILEFNPAFQKILNYSNKELKGKTSFDITPQRWWKFEKEEVDKNQVLKEGYSKIYEKELIRKDKSIITVEVRSYLIKDSSGQAQGIWSYVRDISKSKKNEARLEKINRCFLNFEADPIKNINRLVALLGEITGATAALYNRLDKKLLVSLGQWHTPDNYNPIDKPEGHICYDVIKKDKKDLTIVRDLDQTDYHQSDPNVNKYQLKTYVGYPVSFRNKAIGSLCIVFQKDFLPDDNDKRIFEIVVSAIETEELRMDAEKKSKESEAKYKSIVDNSVDLIMLTGPDGIITYLSPPCESVLGYQPQELVGKQPWIIHPDDLKDVQKAFKDALSGVSGLTIEYRIITKKKRSKWISHSWATLTENSKVKSVVSVLRDIDDQKKSKAKLLQTLDDLKRKNKKFSKMNKLMIGREMKMIQLKKRIKKLGGKLEEEKK
ncbi:PAS domain S-box protein, partial [Patescibacteria group bacterium]|nr:PAS domain S-box protein [Patescibacteria group bacterium]